jgi:4'-phosphopantetheinyl transferase
MWFRRRDQLVLRDDEVHVWRAWLDSASSSSILAGLLSDSEMQKAARFRFSRDRHRFIVAHGVLRSLLGLYLCRDPRSLDFQTNEFGKPSLLAEEDDNAINFNLSHSHDLALFAFVRAREVGVDVEHVRPEFAELAVAQQFFAPEEITELQALDPPLRVNGFFNCWTRKESYIKARGTGLSLPLHDFEVSLRPGSPAALLRHLSDPGESSRWCLHELSPGPGYVGALAVEGHDLWVQKWQW